MIVERKFCDRVVLDDYPINMHHRDEIIKLQILILNILQEPRFSSFYNIAGKKGAIPWKKRISPI